MSCLSTTNTYHICTRCTDILNRDCVLSAPISRGRRSTMKRHCARRLLGEDCCCTRGGVAPMPWLCGMGVMAAAASLCMRSTKCGRSSITRTSCHAGTRNGAADRARFANGRGRLCQRCCCSASNTVWNMCCAHSVGSAMACMTHAGGMVWPGHPQGSSAVDEARARNCAAMRSSVWAMPCRVAAASCRCVDDDAGMFVLLPGCDVAHPPRVCADCCPGRGKGAARARGGGPGVLLDAGSGGPRASVTGSRAPLSSVSFEDAAGNASAAG